MYSLTKQSEDALDQEVKPFTVTLLPGGETEDKLLIELLLVMPYQGGRNLKRFLWK